VSFAAITLCVASQRVFIVISVYLVIDSVRKLLDTPSCAVLTYRNTDITEMNQRCGCTGHDPEPVLSTPHSHNSSSPKIHLNVILPSLYQFSKWTFSNKFPH
jgi:hypothetical protein